jgi:hypothetical protein
MCKGIHGPATNAVERLRLDSLVLASPIARSEDAFDLRLLEYATASVDSTVQEPFPLIAWTNDTAAETKSDEMSRERFGFLSHGLKRKLRERDVLVRCKALVSLNSFDSEATGEDYSMSCTCVKRSRTESV